MEEKKKSKNKIIILVILLAIVVIVIGTIILIPQMSYNRAVKQYEIGEYEKAYNTFEQLSNYKEAEKYKNECIEKTREQITKNIDNAKYEEAIKLCKFLAQFEDTTELEKNAISKYMKSLEENKQYEKAYNLLNKYENIEKEIKQEVQQNYMIYLIENDNVDKGMELLRNTEGLTEDNISKVLGKYIAKEIYPKAYNSLYNSMKNPSSLNVRNYSISVWYYNHDNPSEEGTKASFTYKKDFPYFKADIKFTYSGTNSFGGVVTNNSQYSYWGKVNEDYTLSDVYLRWNY